MLVHFLLMFVVFIITVILIIFLIKKDIKTNRNVLLFLLGSMELALGLNNFNEISAYILLPLGIVLICISLYLTYKKRKEN